MDDLRAGEGRQGSREREDRVESGCQPEAVDQLDQDESPDQADDRAADDLLQESEYELAGDGEGEIRLARSQKLNAGDREEDRHRVVRPALDLERRGHPGPQVHALRAQDREDGGRVGRGDDAAEQEAGDERQLQNPRGGRAGDAGGDEHADRGQQQGRLPHGAHGVQPRLQSAVEQDHGQRERAHGVGDHEVVEVDPPDAVFAGEHADDDEDHEHRQPQPR